MKETVVKTTKNDKFQQNLRKFMNFVKYFTKICNTMSVNLEFTKF